MANRLKIVSKGIYSSKSRPKKVDEARLREIIDRGSPQRQRRGNNTTNRETTQPEQPSQVASAPLAFAR